MSKNRMNWKIISDDLKEAREQIEEIEKLIQDKKYPAEVEFQLMLEHAYRHINFAWNARKVTTKQYMHLTEDEFNDWSSFPKDIQIFKLRKRRKRKD